MKPALLLCGYGIPVVSVAAQHKTSDTGTVPARLMRCANSCAK